MFFFFLNQLRTVREIEREKGRESWGREMVALVSKLQLSKTSFATLHFFCIFSFFFFFFSFFFFAGSVAGWPSTQSLLSLRLLAKGNAYAMNNFSQNLCLRSRYGLGRQQGVLGHMTAIKQLHQKQGNFSRSSEVSSIQRD